MKKQYAVAIVAIILLSVLMVPPVMSGLEDEHVPHFNLIIASVPQGADILIDGEYVGKTPKTIPITDLETHSLRLELDGYEDEERTFQFEPDEEKKEMLITLNKIRPTSTIPEETVQPMPAPHITTPPTPTPAPHTTTPSPTGILTFILAILCGYLILKKWHR
jgi:hypothetical protein